MVNQNFLFQHLHYFGVGQWNRIVVEIGRGLPQEFGVGFSAVRAWVNEHVTPRVYFGDLSGGAYTISDGANAALDICGPFYPTSVSSAIQTLQGYYDVLNFVWIQGARNLFQDTPSKSVS